MKRERIATGIYRDRSGIAIVVSVNGEPREFRADTHGRSYKSWTPAQLIAERKLVEARERLKGEREHRASDTLAADVDRYLRTLSGQSRKDADNLLSHWLTPFGDRPRRSLTAVELRQHAATWTCAASTARHRRQVLVSLFQTLDGPAAPNPARELPKPPDVTHAPRALAYSVIESVFKTMPPSQSRARLKVMAYTGLPQMQIEKLTPEDWDTHRLRVTPRRKGAGAAGRWIPLAPEAQEALKEFELMECWGGFSRSSLCKAWKRYGPKGTNPYSLRHSWITELYRRSNGDVLALQQLAIHARLEQTQRYAAAALQDRMAALVLPRAIPTKRTRKDSNSLHKTPARKKQRQRRHR